METEKDIAILLLAAGSSSRLGQPKQLVRWRGVPLLRHAAITALSAECGPVVVVLGAYLEKIQPVLAGLTLQVIENKNWEIGMGSSIACGMDFLTGQHPELQAVIILVCDQYHLSEKNIRALVMAHRNTNQPIIASGYNGTAGVPALFHRTLFPALLQLKGQEGAKKIIREHGPKVAVVEFSEGVFDLDTKQDLDRIG